MAKPLVSIIINNFNYGRFLRDAIDSALRQTYPNVEVLIVDDGSIDNSRDEIIRYGAQIQSIFKPNGGQASALNVGFAASKGDVIIFLDADDRLRPEVAEYAAFLCSDTCSNLQYDLNVLNESDQGSLGSYRQLCFGSTMISGDLRQQALHGQLELLPTSGNAYPRRVLEQLMPIPEKEWKLCTDIYLNYLAPFYGIVICIPKVLGDYRIHDSNHWTKRNEKTTAERVWLNWQWICRVQESIKDRVEKLGFKSHFDHLIRCPSILLKAKINYLVLENGKDLPYDENLKVLVSQGIKSVWNEESRSFTSKILHLLWFLAVWLLPQKGARILCEKVHQRHPSMTFGFNSSKQKTF